MHNYSALPRARAMDGRVNRRSPYQNLLSSGLGSVVVTGRQLAEADPRERALRLRAGGMSVRQISYLTGVPRGTVGNWVRADHSSLPEPAPFWRLVDF